MKQKKSIPEQVAELTPEQQSNILKAGKIAGILGFIGIVPWAAFLIYRTVSMVLSLISFEKEDMEQFLTVNLILVIAALLYIAGIVVFLKLKYPYYSDKKLRYIKKMRKSGN